MITLNDLTTGDICTVAEILNTGSMRRRFHDIGLIKGTEIQCVGESPSKDPKAFLIRGAVIAIRSEDSSLVVVKRVKKDGTD